MGQKLVDKRKEAGLTQEELAQKSGVSRHTINEIETNKGRNISFNTCKNLANALGTTIDGLFSD